MHTLIFVDDNSETLELLNDLFAIGHQVHVATDMQSALAILEVTKVDMAFIDVVLGDDENGYDVAKKIADHYPEIGIRLMTSHTKATVQEEFGHDFEIFSKMELVLMMETSISSIFAPAFSSERIA